ncbi:MAG: hypothetical protein H7175_25805 [Burkholderiales bacterium]|nr:hypothetical protein [Anaerolineae bacterium]
MMVMMTRVEWDDEEHTILRFDLAKGHTWAEYHAAVLTLVEMSKQTSGRVDVIINNPFGLPPGNPLPELRRTVPVYSTITNLGLVIAINSRRLPGFIESLIKIATQVVGIAEDRSEFVNTLDEARQRIREHRKQSAQA